jgi:hypothetical protein
MVKTIGPFVFGHEGTKITKKLLLKGFVPFVSWWLKEFRSFYRRVNVSSIVI